MNDLSSGSGEGRVKRLVSAEALCWGVFLVFLAAVVIARLRLLPIPLERDEGEYAYLGQLMLQGIPPFKLAYTMKLPGTAAAYALFIAVFGQTASGIHLGFLAMNLASVGLMYVITHRLFGFVAGTFAAVSYALLSVGQSVLGAHAHAAHFVVFMALCGLWLALQAAETGRKATVFLCGLFFGLAFLMKQPGLVFFFVGFLCIFRGPAKASAASGGPDTALRLAVYAAGAVLPFAALCLWLSLAGVFDAFWFWTFRYVFAYTSGNPLAVAPLVFWENFTKVTGSFTALWYIAAAGAVWLCIDVRTRKHAPLVVALCAASFVAICPGFLFRRHYFIVMLPVVSMLAGVCVGSCYSFVSQRSRSRAVGAAVVALFAGILLWSVLQERQYLFVKTPREISRQVYGRNPFIESVAIAAYLEANAAPGDTVAVLGSEPEIYFYSRRHSATGYIYTYPLMEDQPYARKMRDEMMREVEANDPAYIVYVNVDASWIWKASQREKFDLSWLEAYIARRYDTVALMDVDGAENLYYWAAGTAGAAGIRPKSPHYILVFKKRK